MARIDKATIDKIHDSTNIVDVVSDFVSLKRRGSSYLGLCPFHNERTPSFSVSASRGIFKCFSCGKAGNAVSFLMDLENMTYVEALKWLGRKYNIEVEERELTNEEKAAEAERESMIAANEFAMNHFEHNLAETEEGRAIGKAYFRERGISDAMIKRFHLGYALESSTDLLEKARAAGYSDKYLVATGLEIQTDRGTLYDRFKGRVIYPVHSLSGRVVAFGGRTLKKEKTVAKYVNSPESIIYSKSRELYGMFQARNAIARKKNCILVEGYMDVISMHQAGVENVVASSGTSLTEGQISMIRRFADSVTLIYDSDAAGIKASLRGIDMLISAGLAVKLVRLPDGDDPDSFAQSHSSTEVEEYIASNSRDIIGFKADILLKDAGNDPRARGEAINEILKSVALIPDIVEQSLYLNEFSRMSGVPIDTLSAQLKKFIAINAEKTFNKKKAEEANNSISSLIADSEKQETHGAEETPEIKTTPIPITIFRAEEELINQLLRGGMLYYCDALTADDAKEKIPMAVIDYIESELRVDNIEFRHPLFQRVWELALQLRDTKFSASRAEEEARLEAIRSQKRADGVENIRATAKDHNEIQKLERELEERLEAEFNEAFDDFASGYIRAHMLRCDDREIIDIVARLTSEPVVLSRMYPKVDTHKLVQHQLPIAIFTLKSSILKHEMDQILKEFTEPHTAEEYTELQRRYQEKKDLSMMFDKFTGEIVITPISK